MLRENQRLVTNEPVEFEKYSIEVRDFARITDHVRGIYRENIPPMNKATKPEDVQHVIRWVSNHHDLD